MLTSVVAFYILLLIVAFLYASVGHGGASGYLALMALFQIAPETMRPTALVLNLFVSGIAFFQFYKAKHFVWSLFLPLAVASVPMSFVGGMMEVNAVLYKRILGVLLIFPILRLLGVQKKSVEQPLQQPKQIWLLLIGASIGLLSGMIGIGGGIMLSPILMLLRWVDQKQNAAVGALFIFVNSLAGLGGQFSTGLHFNNEMFGYVAVALVGGVAGSYLGAKKFNQFVLKKLLVVVLIIASAKLLSI